MSKHGVVPVEVKPVAVPQPSGEVKLGAGAAAYLLSRFVRPVASPRPARTFLVIRIG